MAYRDVQVSAFFARLHRKFPRGRGNACWWWLSLAVFSWKNLEVSCFSTLVVLKVGGIAPLGGFWGSRWRNNTKGRKRSTLWDPSFPTSYLVEERFLAVTSMLSKQRNRLLIHKRGDLWLYLTKWPPSFVKAAKHIHYTELGTVQWYASTSLNKFLNNTWCLLYLDWGTKTMCREWKGGDGKKVWETLIYINTTFSSIVFTAYQTNANKYFTLSLLLEPQT